MTQTAAPPPRQAALGAAIVAVISVAVVAPHVFPLTSISTISYEWVDADLFLWNFWWTKQALGAAQSPYWTGLMMYPSGASLAFHSYPMPYSLLTLPVQAAIADVGGLVVSFNGIVLISSVASGLGAYFLALRVTRSVPSAVIAGLVFVCAPYRTLNISRLHVLATEVLAWYAWAWVGFAETPTRVRAFVVGALLALAFHTSPEYAMQAAGFSTLWIAWMSLSKRGHLASSFWRRTAMAAVVFIVLASPLLVAQVRGVARGGATLVRTLDGVAYWSPALSSFVTPSRVHPVYGEILSPLGDYGTPGVMGMRSETSVALTIWALVFAAAFRMRRDGSRFWFIAAGVFLILTLGPYLRLTGTMTTSVPLPYAALYLFIPPLHFVRDPTRFFASTLLALSVISAFGVRGLLERLRGRVAFRVAAVAAVGALVIFEGLTVRAARVPADALISPAYDSVAASTGEFALLDLSPDQTALVAQTQHGRPITAGRTSNPRSVAASKTLDVARDFLDAARTLALDPGTLASRLAADRRELERLHLRFVVFPAGNPAQIALAERLGLRVLTEGELVVCERQP